MSEQEKRTRRSSSKRALSPSSSQQMTKKEGQEEQQDLGKRTKREDHLITTSLPSKAESRMALQPIIAYLASLRYTLALHTLPLLEGPISVLELGTIFLEMSTSEGISTTSSPYCTQKKLFPIGYTTLSFYQSVRHDLLIPLECEIQMGTHDQKKPGPIFIVRLFAEKTTYFRSLVAGKAWRKAIEHIKGLEYNVLKQMTTSMKNPWIGRSVQIEQGHGEIIQVFLKDENEHFKIQIMSEEGIGLTKGPIVEVTRSSVGKQVEWLTDKEDGFGLLRRKICRVLEGIPGVLKNSLGYTFWGERHPATSLLGQREKLWTQLGHVLNDKDMEQLKLDAPEFPIEQTAESKALRLQEAREAREERDKSKLVEKMEKQKEREAKKETLRLSREENNLAKVEEKMIRDEERQVQKTIKEQLKVSKDRERQEHMKTRIEEANVRKSLRSRTVPPPPPLSEVSETNTIEENIFANKTKMLSYLKKEKRSRESMKEMEFKYLMDCSNWTRTKSRMEEIYNARRLVLIPASRNESPMLSPAVDWPSAVPSSVVEDTLFVWNFLFQFASILELPTVPDLQSFVNVIFLRDGSAADGNGRVQDTSHGAVLAGMHVSMVRLLMKEYLPVLHSDISLEVFEVTHPITITSWPEMARICCQLAIEKFYNFSGDETLLRGLRGNKTVRYDTVTLPIREEMNLRGKLLLKGESLPEVKTENDIESEETSKNGVENGQTLDESSDSAALFYGNVIEDTEFEIVVNRPEPDMFIVKHSTDPRILPGHCLIAVNGTRVDIGHLSLSDVEDLIQDSPRPLGLCLSKTKLSLHIKKRVMLEQSTLTPEQSTKRCAQVLSVLRSKALAAPFNEPVSVELYPDYYNGDFISEPMDLGTIKEKLEEGEYDEDDDPIAAFCEDVNLVWANCYTFNSEKAVISHSAKKLTAVFARLMREWVHASPPRVWVANGEASCRCCERAFDKGSIMLCDHCDGSYHAYCLNPSFSSVPPGAWYCPQCINDTSFTVPKGKSHSDMAIVGDADGNAITADEYIRLQRASQLLSREAYSDSTVAERLDLLRTLCELVEQSVEAQTELETMEASLSELRTLRNDLPDLSELKQSWDFFAPPYPPQYQPPKLSVTIGEITRPLTNDLLDYLIKEISSVLDDSDVALEEVELPKMVNDVDNEDLFDNDDEDSSGVSSDKLGSHSSVESLVQDVMNEMLETIEDAEYMESEADSDMDEEEMLEKYMDEYGLEHEKDDDDIDDIVPMCYCCGFGEQSSHLGTEFTIHKCILSESRGLFLCYNPPTPILLEQQFQHPETSALSIQVWKKEDFVAKHFCMENKRTVLVEGTRHKTVFALNGILIGRKNLMEMKSVWEIQSRDSDYVYVTLFDTACTVPRVRPDKKEENIIDELPLPSIDELKIHYQHINVVSSDNIKEHVRTLSTGASITMLQWIGHKDTKTKLFLYAVNGNMVAGMDTEAVCTLLREESSKLLCLVEPRSAVVIENEREMLHEEFLQDSAKEVLEKSRRYHVQFSAGSLGMGLAFNVSMRKAIVRSLNPLPSGAPSQALACRKIREGDLIMAINGQSYSAGQLTDFTTLLMKCPRPLQLSFFRPPTADEQKQNDAIEGRTSLHVNVDLLPLPFTVCTKNGALYVQSSNTDVVKIGSRIEALNGTKLPGIGVEFFQSLLLKTTLPCQLEISQSAKNKKSVQTCRIVYAHTSCIPVAKEAQKEARMLQTKLREMVALERILMWTFPRTLSLGHVKSLHWNLFHFPGEPENLYVQSTLENKTWSVIVGRTALVQLFGFLRYHNVPLSLLEVLEFKYHRVLHASPPRLLKSAVATPSVSHTNSSFNFFDLKIVECCSRAMVEHLNDGGPLSLRKCVYHDLRIFQWKGWISYWGRKYYLGSFGSRGEMDGAYERAATGVAMRGTHLVPFSTRTFPVVPGTIRHRCHKMWKRFNKLPRTMSQVPTLLTDAVMSILDKGYVSFEGQYVRPLATESSDPVILKKCKNDQNRIQIQIQIVAETGKQLVGKWTAFCQAPSRETAMAMAKTSGTCFEEVRTALVAVSRSPLNGPHPKSFLALYHAYVVGFTASMVGRAVSQSTISQENARLMKSIVDSFAVALLSSMEPSDENLIRAHQSFQNVETTGLSSCTQSSDAVRVASMGLMSFCTASNYNHPVHGLICRPVLMQNARPGISSEWMRVMSILNTTRQQFEFRQRLALAEQHKASGDVFVDVAFIDGPLGIVINQIESGVILIGRFSCDPYGNPGQAEKSGKVSIGDIVVAVNGQPIENIGMDGFRSSVKSARRPLHVTFRRPKEAAIPSSLSNLSVEKQCTPVKASGNASVGNTATPVVSAQGVLSTPSVNNTVPPVVSTRNVLPGTPAPARSIAIASTPASAPPTSSITTPAPALYAPSAVTTPAPARTVTALTTPAPALSTTSAVATPAPARSITALTTPAPALSADSAVTTPASARSITTLTTPAPSLSTTSAVATPAPALMVTIVTTPAPAHSFATLATPPQSMMTMPSPSPARRSARVPRPVSHDSMAVDEASVEPTKGPRIINVLEATAGRGQLGVAELERFAESLLPRSAEAPPALIVLRALLLEMEAVLPREAFRRGYWSENIRIAWSERVFSSTTSARLMECVLFLESCFELDWLDIAWKSASMSTARNALTDVTIASVSMRLRALDENLLYTKKSFKRKNKGNRLDHHAQLHGNTSNYSPNLMSMGSGVDVKPISTTVIPRPPFSYIERLPEYLWTTVRDMLHMVIHRRREQNASAVVTIKVEEYYALMHSSGLSRHQVDEWTQSAIEELTPVVPVPPPASSTKRKASPRPPRVSSVKKPKKEEEILHSFIASPSTTYSPNAVDSTRRPRLAYVVQLLMAHPLSWPFNEPVNPAYVPGYADIIKFPMDLGTIAGHVQSGRYDVDVSAFVSAMELVWSNCRLYNQPGSEIALSGHRLSSLFSRLFEQCITNVSIESPFSCILSEENCRQCGKTEGASRTDSFLACDSCDGMFHMQCLPIKLTSIPDGSWYCPRCPPINK